ncbi:hypothetical protein F975_01507 [Acinetobacter sp. ANC 3789]|uniref:hypothetical protein n=1 Tax=Acinetobacter sp. ANC 3789 TaxID=1217714 RepID=UPI0002CF8A43|nr:hypothetical protein [Acinetobacter sp. ANC 3789]ENU80453.1 hypothetical protein F975_01507 [Acinetobacter sp. ANC 3789]
MKLEISAFYRMKYSLRAFSQEYVVALQSASVPFDANNRNGVVIIPVSQAGNRSGLILGLGDFDLDQLEQAIQILSELIQTCFKH